MLPGRKVTFLGVSSVYVGMKITDNDILDHIVRLDARYIGNDSSGRYVLAEFDDDGGIIGQLALTPEEYHEWGSIDAAERCFSIIDICTTKLDGKNTVEVGFVLDVLDRVRDMMGDQVNQTKRIVRLWLELVRNGGDQHQ